MAKPAARITDPTSCPIPGHGPKAIACGSPDMYFDGLAAARKDDKCTCGSALASAVSSTVFINGQNAALVGTVGSHGDVVIGGSGTVIIGSSHTPAPFIPPTPMVIHGNWIGFKIPAEESYEGLTCTATLTMALPCTAYLMQTIRSNSPTPPEKRATPWHSPIMRIPVRPQVLTDC